MQFAGEIGCGAELGRGPAKRFHFWGGLWTWLTGYELVEVLLIFLFSPVSVLVSLILWFFISSLVFSLFLHPFLACFFNIFCRSSFFFSVFVYKTSNF